MAVSTKTEVGELANQLSQWCQQEMSCEVSPDNFLLLLHNPEMVNMWTYIINNVKSLTPLDACYTKVEELTNSTTETVSCCNRLKQEESVLDMEIIDLAKNFDVQSSIMTTEKEKINQVQSEVFMHPSRMVFQKSYLLLLHNKLKRVSQLINKVDTALTEFPSQVSSDSLQLSTDVQDILDMIDNYYQTARSVTTFEGRHEIHKKVKKMAKHFKCEQYLENLSIQVKDQKHKYREEEEQPDLQMIKEIMGERLEYLQVAHKASFITVLALCNRINVLESKKAAVMDQFKQHIKHAPNKVQLEELQALNLKIIQRQEVTKCLLDYKVPTGMPEPAVMDLEQVQLNIEEEEEAIEKIYRQIVKVLHANKSTIEKFNLVMKAESQDSLGDIANESKQLQLMLSFQNIVKDLEKIEEVLPQIKTCDSDISNLCIRPGSRVISETVREKLQTSLDMPFYEAPEMLGIRLRNKMDNLRDKHNTRKVQSQLLSHLNPDSLVFNRIFKALENSNANAVKVNEKANALSERVRSSQKCDKLKASLHDLKEQPAFDADIFRDL